MQTKGKENLAESIRQKIVERIVSGQYAAGRKIPSVRALMEEFSVSSQTVQRALRLLQEARAVTAIHGSGVFVNADPARSFLRLAMIFPEESISTEYLDLENWGLNSELHRGLLAGAVQADARLEFRHISEESGAEVWRGLAAELYGYNGVIFAGRQLSGLQQFLSHRLPVFQIISLRKETKGVIAVDYDRDMALRTLLQKASEQGCRTASCFTFQDRQFPEQYHFFLSRATQMLQLCREYNLQPLHQTPLTITPETCADLKSMISGEKADFLFCNHSFMTRDVFDLCRKNHKSVLLGAIGSGFTFQNLYPGMIYMRVPMFEAGQGIVRCVRRLAEGTSMDEACKDLQDFRAELMLSNDFADSLPMWAGVSLVSE